MTQNQKQSPLREGRELRIAQMMPPASGESPGQEMRVEGRPVVFGQRTELFKIDGNSYYEVINPGALDETDMRDVVMRYNHSEDRLLLARTRGGSLELLPDDTGLFIRATFFETTQARDLYELIKAGAVDKMSFAFSIREESFDKETRTWTVRKIDRIFDVAAVDQPAYDATSLSARRVQSLESERRAALERARELDSARRKRLLLRTMTY